MKVRDHMAIIREQLKAMHADGHDFIPLVGIHLQSIELSTGAIIEAEHKAKQDKK